MPDNLELTVANFEMTALRFVSLQFTDFNQLRQCRKPRKLTVREFHYRLTELNALVQWFPGQLLILTAEERAQTFYDAMPNAW